MGRANKIAANAREARAHYKNFVNDPANAEYNPRIEAAPASEFDTLMTEKESMKEAQVAQILQALRESAEAANAAIYAETKTVLLSENAPHRQTVLKIAALDDLMLEEKKKLAVASTDKAATEAATRLYDIELLKAELDEARHQSRLPTPEQEARFTALIAGINFGNMSLSLYRRLIANNASQTAKEKANANAAAAIAAAAVIAPPRPPPAPIAPPPPPPAPIAPVNQGQVLGGPGAAPPANKAAARAARLAALAKRGLGGRRTRHQRKSRTRRHRKN